MRNRVSPALLLGVAVLCTLGCQFVANAVTNPDPDLNKENKPYKMYDAVKDETSVNVFYLYGLSDISCRIFYSYDGKTAKRPKTISLALGGSHDEPEWDRIKTVFVRFGSTRLTLPVRYTVNRGERTGIYMEALTASIPVETFEKIKTSNALFFVLNDTRDYAIPAPYFSGVKQLVAGLPAKDSAPKAAARKPGPKRAQH